ncbi:Uncharacterized protein dnm_025960 [Desulfonema magnum]|uniref:Uncharacterized protein n=1 Tax=Desulfonema magnum TaxID=45655 RepID=A0A975BJ79_9BACT|nr:Uncharacterized protein dnm_025960 [Desulfonema magnum]
MKMIRHSRQFFQTIQTSPGVMKMSQTGLTIAIPFLFRKFFMT